MSHDTHRIEPRDAPAADTQPPNAPPAQKQAGAPIQRWLQRAAAALARAEQRITENFRVPPHGG